MGELLAFLAQNQANYAWIFWCLTDLFTSDQPAFSWRDDFFDDVDETGTHTVHDDQGASFLLAKAQGDKAVMELLPGAELPGVFALAMAAVGLDPTQRRWEIFIDLLHDRLSQCDALHSLLMQCRLASPDRHLELASALAVLATEWDCCRSIAFAEQQESSKTRREVERVRQRAIDLGQEWHCIVDLELFDDPRGSALRVRFAENTRALPVNVLGSRVDWSISRPPVPVQTAGTVAKFRVRGTRLHDTIVAALSSAAVTPSCLRLNIQLKPAQFQQLQLALRAIGGAWNGATEQFHFDADPRQALADIVQSRSALMAKDFEFFETPDFLVRRVIERAQLKPGMSVLEPQAGAGALALAAARVVGIESVVAYELMPANARLLQAAGIALAGVSDFLAVEPEPRFSRVVMNPPFSAGRDIAHVTHALRFLEPGGRLVAITSCSWQANASANARKFAELVRQYRGSVEEIPRGAFKASGTDVPTLLVTMDAPGVQIPASGTDLHTSRTPAQPAELQPSLF